MGEALPSPGALLRFVPTFPGPAQLGLVVRSGMGQLSSMALPMIPQVDHTVRLIEVLVTRSGPRLVTLWDPSSLTMGATQRWCELVVADTSVRWLP